MKRPARWLRRLSVDGAVLTSIPGLTDMYGVFPNGDLRRRPLARLSRAIMVEARAAGLIREVAADCYRLDTSPDAHAQREAGDYLAAHQQVRAQTLIDANGQADRRAVNVSDSPLARWIRPDPKTGRSWLSETEFDAGERLRADYHRSVLCERVTSDWDGYLAPASGRSSGIADQAPVSALAARTRVYSALDAVGPGLDRILSAICLRETGLETVERAESWPRRSGKAMLKVALQRLAVHYGLISRPSVRP